MVSATRVGSEQYLAGNINGGQKIYEVWISRLNFSSPEQKWAQPVTKKFSWVLCSVLVHGNLSLVTCCTLVVMSGFKSFEKMFQIYLQFQTRTFQTLKSIVEKIVLKTAFFAKLNGTEKNDIFKILLKLSKVRTELNFWATGSLLFWSGEM